MIPAKRDSTGAIILPVEPGNTIVTYYASRLNPAATYDPIDNPIVMYRVEYQYDDTTNPIDITAERFTTSSCKANNYQWLAHNVYGESVINQLGNSQSFTKTLATPRGLSLVASRAFRVSDPTSFPPSTVNANTEAPFKPDSSFTCLDTNGDGKIDRVNISLAVANYDTSSNGSLRNGQPSGQTLRAERTVVLPNIQ